MDNESNVVQSQEPIEPVVQSAPVEKMLAQSEVNEIVGRAKKDAVESYKRQSVQQHAPQSQNTFAESDVRRLAAEEAQRLRDDWVTEAKSKSEQDYAQRIVKSFWEKVDASKGKYEDFDKVAGDIELQRFPNVVQLLAEHIDNSGDVLYELGKDRLKMAQLEQLAYLSPKDAITQAKRMAESIKSNESVSNVKQAREPLSQQRPSNLGTGSEVLSVGDYRRKYRV